MANQSAVLVAARAEAVRALLTAGPAHLRFYSGPAPASTADAATGTLLADVVMSASVPEPVTGVIALSAADDAQVAVTGTAGWARLSSSTNQPLLDMSCGLAESGAELVFSSLDLYAGGFVRLSSLTLG